MKFIAHKRRCSKTFPCQSLLSACLTMNAIHDEDFDVALDHLNRDFQFLHASKDKMHAFLGAELTQRKRERSARENLQSRHGPTAEIHDQVISFIEFSYSNFFHHSSTEITNCCWFCFELLLWCQLSDRVLVKSHSRGSQKLQSTHFASTFLQRSLSSLLDTSELKSSKQRRNSTKAFTESFSSSFWCRIFGFPLSAGELRTMSRDTKPIGEHSRSDIIEWPEKTCSFQSWKCWLSSSQLDACCAPFCSSCHWACCLMVSKCGTPVLIVSH